MTSLFTLRSSFLSCIICLTFLAKISLPALSLVSRSEIMVDKRFFSAIAFRSSSSISRIRGSVVIKPDSSWCLSYFSRVTSNEMPRRSLASSTAFPSNFIRESCCNSKCLKHESMCLARSGASRNLVSFSSGIYSSYELKDIGYMNISSKIRMLWSSSWILATTLLVISLGSGLGKEDWDC